MKNVPEDRLVGKNVPNCSGVVVVLVENLCKSTTYYFCVSASNQAGRSANSEVVQCTTLLPGESVIPGLFLHNHYRALNSFYRVGSWYASIFAFYSFMKWLINLWILQCLLLLRASVDSLRHRYRYTAPAHKMSLLSNTYLISCCIAL